MKKFFLFMAILFINVFADNIDQLEILKKQLEFCDLLGDPKAVLACKNNILLLAAQNQTAQQTSQNKTQSLEQKNNPSENETKEILMNIANVFSNLGKIGLNKQNPTIVGQSIFDIIASIITVVAKVAKD